MLLFRAFATHLVLESTRSLKECWGLARAGIDGASWRRYCSASGGHVVYSLLDHRSQPTAIIVISTTYFGPCCCWEKRKWIQELIHQTNGERIIQMQEKRHGVEGKDGMYSRAKRMVVSSGFMIPLPPSTQGDKLAGRA
jgi:hypothetical protein